MVIFVKLLLAVVLGSIIGLERAVVAKQAAGMRTFGLVSLGSCLFIVTSSFVDQQYLGVVNFDPMHISTGIITGIGFIGGGLIIFRGNTLHGVTTAAGLWIVTAVGMSVGFGMYAIAIFATLLSILMLTGMWYVEHKFIHWFEEHKEGLNHIERSI